MNIETRTSLLSTTSAQLKSNPLIRWTAILLWLVIALLCIGLYLIDVGADYSDFATVCDGEWEINSGCPVESMPSVELEALNSWGFSLEQYALYAASLGLIAPIIYFSLGFLIFWRLGVTPLGLMISLALIVSPFAIYASGRIWADMHPLLFISGIIAVILSNIIQTSFLLLIPNGRFSPRWASYLLVLGTIDLVVLTLYVNSIITLPDTVATIIIIIPVSLIFLGIAFQVYRYRYDSTAEEKQQTKWIALGVGAYFSGIFLWVMTYGNALGLEPGGTRLLILIIAGHLLQVLLAALPIGIAIAILRYNLWNIDIVLNRSLVGLAVTAVLAIIFGASVFLVQTVLDASNPLVGLVVSAIGPILLFNPTRKRVRHFVDRRLYGFAFDLNELQQAQRAHKITNPGKLSGRTLGDYTVLDVLGKGGMGEVYKGQGNGEIVAIKTMLAEIATEPGMKTRFSREAEIGRTLDHPNIAKVYTSGEYDGTPYLIMEYIDGMDIRQQLKAGESYDIETAITMIQQICDALDTAHAKGYVHRDIKPANLIQRPNGTIVLMDFGITKVENASVALTGTGAIGTITYMAPEQIIAAKDVDHRADIYALGIVFYELLTGRVPFDGAPAQVLFAHLQQPAPDPSDSDPSIPTEVADAILKALEKDPDDRFQSAGEFASTLKNIAV